MLWCKLLFFGVFSRSFVIPVLSALGLLWTSIEILQFWNTSWAELVKPFWWLFLFTGILCGFVSIWPRLSVSRRIVGTDTDVHVHIGDVLDASNSLMIGATTTFDTTVHDGTISGKSVQGQFTSKYFDTEGHLSQLMTQEISLLSSPRTLSAAEKPYGRRRLFDRGDLIRIEGNHRLGYFCALATLNEHRTAVLSSQEYLDALPIIWASIRDKGEFGDLDCPLIGAGYSRLNLTKKQVLTALVKSFVAATKEGRLVESVHIYIRSSDFNKGKFALREIEKMLEHECCYNARLDISVGRVDGVEVG